MFAQATNRTPSQGTASIQTTVDEARDALKHYQTALASARGLPEIATTVREDSQVVLASRNTVDWLRAKVDLEGAVVPSEFEGLLDSIDVSVGRRQLQNPVADSCCNIAIALTGV
jgi:hypothetical protein